MDRPYNPNELDQNNSVLVGIRSYLQGKYPGFYITLQIVHQQDQLTVRVRYSLRYFKDRFPGLYDRYCIFRLDLRRYYYPLGEHNDNTLRIISDILSYSLLHIKQDIEAVGEGGIEYLKSFNIPINEFYQSVIYTNTRFDNFGNCNDPAYYESPFSPCPFYYEDTVQEVITNPIVNAAIINLEDRLENQEQIRQQIADDYYFATRRHEFMGLDGLVRQGNIDGTWWASRESSKEANKKAEELLLECLSEEQKEQYKKDKTFICYGHKTGTKYRVLPILEINIEVYDENDKIKHKLCITPQEITPKADQQLAIKLMLEANEDYLLKTAIPWKITSPF